MPASPAHRSSSRLVRLPRAGLALLVAAGGAFASSARAAEAAPAPEAPGPAQAAPRIFIREFRVQGATVLDADAIQKKVYPYLGPGRTEADVEAARAALEKLYHDQGYQAASVEVPPQKLRRGVLFLRVNEGQIARLRIKGSRYNDLAQIRDSAPSLAEGTVPNFNAISHDLVALNGRPDRRITPEIAPAPRQPGALDVTLKVEDRPPVSASVELNDRYSSGTTRLRLDSSVSYDNLWQAGHSLGASVQTSPLDWSEVLVYSGSYLARFASLPEWSFSFSATRQDTDISTLGGAAVAGRGDVFSLRATRVLPGSPDLFHSVSLGIDRKHYENEVTTAGSTDTTPITYYPISALYSGFVKRPASTTDYYAGVTFHVRGLGSDSEEFDTNRYQASANFLTLRGDVSQTWNLPADAHLGARVQAQVASGALLSNEQFAAGGFDTVRGYLEGEVLGDDALVGSLELSSPSLLPANKREDTLTAHVFADGGVLLVSDTLPDQDDHYELASVGVGFRFHVIRHFAGGADLAFPLVDQGETGAGEPRVTFFIKGQL